MLSLPLIVNRFETPGRPKAEKDSVAATRADGHAGSGECIGGHVVAGSGQIVELMRIETCRQVGVFALHQGSGCGDFDNLLGRLRRDSQIERGDLTDRDGNLVEIRFQTGAGSRNFVIPGT